MSRIPDLTQVTLPEWQLEPDEETYFGQPDEGLVAPDGAMDQALDAAGVPEEQGDTPAPAPAPARQAAPPPPRTQLDQQWLDQVLPPGSARRQPAPQPQPQRPQGVRPPVSTSPRTTDPLQPAPNTPQQ